MAELDQHFVGIENDLIEKQKLELDNLREKLERTLSQKSKPSSTLLNLRQVQANLVKQKKYTEANETKNKAAELEAEEDEKWLRVRADKIAYQEAQLMQKHTKEREGHNKRTQTAMAELEIDKNKKMGQLVQNYNNEKKQTLSMHNIVLAQISKYEKKGSPLKKAADMSESEVTDNSPVKLV